MKDRPALARGAAQIRRAVRRLSHLFPQLLTGARWPLFLFDKRDNVDLSALSGARHLASSGRTSFRSTRRCAMPIACSATSNGGARSASTFWAARRPDPLRRWPGARTRRAKNRPARSTAAACGDAGDDLAHGICRPGFRLGLARARLPHGSPPAVPAETGAGRVVTETASAERRRWKRPPDHGGCARHESRPAAGVRRSAPPQPCCRRSRRSR